jgi:hypothetical protein
LSADFKSLLAVNIYEGTIMNSWKARRPPAWDLKSISNALTNPTLNYLPSIENVHEWDRKDKRLLGTGEIRDVGVESDLLR